MNICVCLCMYVHMYAGIRGAQREHQMPGAKVTGSYEPLGVGECWELIPCPLKDQQQALLTTKSSLLHSHKVLQHGKASCLFSPSRATEIAGAPATSSCYQELYPTFLPQDVYRSIHSNNKT